MATRKLRKAIVVTSDKAAAKAVADQLGDNKRLTIGELETAIIRAGSSEAQLHLALRQINCDQAATKFAAMVARWYVLDYMAAVEAGKLSAKYSPEGAAIIPAMTDEKRAYYSKLLKGANVDAKTLKPDQVRRTVDQDKAYAALRKWWQRCLFAAGVKTVSAQGGARVKKGKKAKLAKGAAMAQNKPLASAILPPVPNAAAAATWLQTEAGRMVQFCSKNKSHAAKFAAIVIKFQEELVKAINAK